MFANEQAHHLRALLVAGLLVSIPIGAISEGPAPPSAKPVPAQTVRVAEHYGQLPLSFEANTGQADHRVQFLSRGKGYGLYLTQRGAVLVLAKPGASPDTVRMKLAGSTCSAGPVAEDALPGTTNYFIGNDPAKWRTRIPTYAQVRYRSIYRGIDLVYYGSQGQLEYDFVVAPGADPRQVRLQFAKAQGLQLRADGDLALATSGGTLVLHRPTVYQLVNGERRAVSGRFSMFAEHTVGLRLGAYDRTKTLVIDPVLTYSTFLGGSGGDTGYAIATDAAGNVYIGGSTGSTDFPITAGSFQTADKAAANGAVTAFVCKLNAAGTALLYSTYLGGSGTTNPGGGPIGDSVRALAVDGQGNVYIGGGTGSTDFPITAGSFQKTNKAAASFSSTAFVTKLNATGTTLVYSTYLGGSGLVANGNPEGGDAGNAIAVDNAGNAYVAGTTFSSDFPVTSGAFETTNLEVVKYHSSAFISKLNATGTALVYSTYLCGTGAEFGGETGNAIAVDAAGEVYVAGSTASYDLPVTSGAFQTTNKMATNDTGTAYVGKLNSTGTALVYATYLGGSFVDGASALALDALGDAYVAGATSSTDFPVTAGAFQPTSHITEQFGENAFVSKLNPSGTVLVYSTYLGGSGGVINLSPTLEMYGGDSVNGLAVDSQGNAYVTGGTASADFPVTPQAYQPANQDSGPFCVSCAGGYNAFVTEVNPAGTALVYSTYLGGNGVAPVWSYFSGIGDLAHALALDNSGNVTITGSTTSADFPITAGAFQTTFHKGQAGYGFQTGFVARLNLSPTSPTTPTVTVAPSAPNIANALPVSVTVTVSGASGMPVPTGTITLTSGGYSSGAVTLNTGSATIVIPAGTLYNGPEQLTANYTPDAASTATYGIAEGFGAVNIIAAHVVPTPSVSTLTWAQSQSQSISVAISVTGANGIPTPTGTVTLSNGNYSSAPTALTGGNATVVIPAGALGVGFLTLVASYSGDGNYTPESGNAYVIIGSVTVTVTPQSPTMPWTQPVPVTITVAPAPGAPATTGSVTLVGPGFISSATPLVNGSVTINVPAETLRGNGADELIADYTGNYEETIGYGSVTITGGPPDFTIGVAASITVTRGATTGNTLTVTVTPSGGFTGSVTLTPTFTSFPVNAQLPTLSFGSTSPVSITGTAAGTATLTVTTTEATTQCVAEDRVPRTMPWYAEGGAILACTLLFGIPARRRTARTLLSVLALFFFFLSGGVLGCSGGSPNASCAPVSVAGTTPGNYDITVTGTSGTMTANSYLTLTVQ